jgi:hypothetical protein
MSLNKENKPRKMEELKQKQKMAFDCPIMKNLKTNTKHPNLIYS